MIVNGRRELAYVVKIDDIKPIVGSDNCECAVVGGWQVMVKKGTFNIGDLAVYFEIDSKVPETEIFSFLIKKHFVVKTQKYTFGGKGSFISQGLLMSFKDFGWKENAYKEGTPLTDILKVRYAVEEDNKRKNPIDKYTKMYQRNFKFFKKHKIATWLYNKKLGKKILFIFLGKKGDCGDYAWPSGKFPGVSKTDQERIENMTWVLEDKTPYIVTQKCDGSSGTYILERKKKGFEFYVCSRNMRIPNAEDAPAGTGCYWEVAKKYKIEEKMKDYLLENPDINFICWQGEICSPNIQKNPHFLTSIHFYCFHMTDSKNGRYDIRKAKKIWSSYDMEVVPIINDNYILPDDFEEFKRSADGYYDSSVCESNQFLLITFYFYDIIILYKEVILWKNILMLLAIYTGYMIYGLKLETMRSRKIL